MKYKGIITPMLTPFDRHGNVSEEYTLKLIEVLKDNGVNGLFPMGSTGVFPFLSTRERKEFLEFVLKNDQGLPVLVGIGSSSTADSVELARHAMDSGADAVVLMPPYYIKPDQNEIIEHFRHVLEAVDIDFFIYNIPQLAGQRIELETMQKLKKEYSQIKGVKDSGGDMRFFQRVVTLSDPGFSVLQGQDDLIYLSLMAGADGGICGTTNIFGGASKIYDLVNRKENSQALRLQLEVVNPLMDSLNNSVFPSGYYYAFYRLFGLDGGFRSPMVEPDRSAADTMFNQIKGILETSIKYK